MNAVIKTTYYYGPLEILLKWLLSKEIDPFKIEISILLEEFAEFYLKEKELTFREKLEFLFALSFFMLYKTNLLFGRYKENQTIDNKEEVKVESVSFVEIIEFLTKRLETMSKMFTREETEYIVSEEEKLDPSILFSIFEKLIQKVPEIKEKLPEIPKIEEKIELIMDSLNKKNFILFSELILSAKSKIEAIVTFLALLELIRLEKIKCVQEKLFEDIKIYRRE
ncbi:MAG: segregation/condensation protein A [Candidatus Hydrothermales bacterium]